MMKLHRWRFAFSRRWFGYLAFAILFAIVCVFLSNWQAARGRETAAENARIARNYDAKPVPLSQALPALHSYSGAQEWSQVRMTGTYLRSDQLLVRNRPLDGNPGFEVLTPLRLRDGSVFVIDRGWVPTGNRQDRPDSVPAAPKGTVTVVARLKASEPTLSGRSAPKGEIATIHLPTIAKQLSGDRVHTAAYGLMASEKPAPATRPKPLDRPHENVGLHWSYMIQWLIFAAIGFFGLGYAVRREFLARNSEDEDVKARIAERDRKRALRERTDAEVEDEILDRTSR